jgi:hypothetical protein
MPYKWTEGYQRTNALLDSDEVNREYNNYKNVLNGGIDRENIPLDAVTDLHLKSQAFWSYDLTRGIQPGLSTGVTHITYHTYHGGWRTDPASARTLTLREGMLHVDFSCWFQFVQLHPANEQRWCRFQLLLDNSVIARTGKDYSYVGNVNLSACVPVAGGAHTVDMQWQFTPPAVATAASTDAFFFSGGQLLINNRYR